MLSVTPELLVGLLLGLVVGWAVHGKLMRAEQRRLRNMSSAWQMAFTATKDGEMQLAAVWRERAFRCQGSTLFEWLGKEPPAWWVE